MTESDAFELINGALNNKALKHPDFHSHHEAYGVLCEEVDEYFEHVRERKPSMAGCREELADVAAVCMKALMQLCVTEPEEPASVGINNNVCPICGCKDVIHSELHISMRDKVRARYLLHSEVEHTCSRCGFYWIDASEK